MTLKEFKETIEIMRGAYKFEDEKTLMRVGSAPSGRYDHITLVTEDSTGTVVTLEREAERSEESPWGRYGETNE